MTRICWWLVNQMSRVLEPAERDAVHGDFAESRETGAQALRDVLGLVVRRQIALWHDSRPWLVLVGVVVPFGLLISLVSRRVAEMEAVYAWMYFDNWDWALLEHRAYWIILGQIARLVSPEILVLICLAWTVGFALGALSRPTIPVNGALFCVALLFGEFVAVPWYTQLQLHALFGPQLPRLEDADAGSLTFYKAMFPLLVQIVLVLLPALWGMSKGLGLAALPVQLRLILWTPAVATMAVLASWQAVVWIAVATQDMTLLRSGWQLPLLPFAVAGPVVYWVATASWRHWHKKIASV
jgi:hypothetical protein